MLYHCYSLWGAAIPSAPLPTSINEGIWLERCSHLLWTLEALKLLTCFNNAAVWDLPNVIRPNGSNFCGMSHFILFYVQWNESFYGPHTSSYVIVRIIFLLRVYHCVFLLCFVAKKPFKKHQWATQSCSFINMNTHPVVYFHNLTHTHTHTHTPTHTHTRTHLPVAMNTHQNTKCELIRHWK